LQLIFGPQLFLCNFVQTIQLTKRHRFWLRIDCIFCKKTIFLVNLTSAVYISSSGCTLTFGAKSEGSLACSPFAGHRRGRSLNPLRGAALELLWSGQFPAISFQIFEIVLILHELNVADRLFAWLL